MLSFNLVLKHFCQLKAILFKNPTRTQPTTYFKKLKEEKMRSPAYMAFISPKKLIFFFVLKNYRLLEYVEQTIVEQKKFDF